MKFNIKSHVRLYKILCSLVFFLTSISFIRYKVTVMVLVSFVFPSWITNEFLKDVSVLICSVSLLWINAPWKANVFLPASVFTFCRTNDESFPLTSFLFLFSLTDVGLFLTNNRISESFPFTRKTLTESIDDLLYVQNNTMKELNKILRDDLERAVGSSMTEFRGKFHLFILNLWHEFISYITAILFLYLALAYCGSDIKYSESLKRSTFQLKEATQSALSGMYYLSLGLYIAYEEHLTSGNNTFSLLSSARYKRSSYFGEFNIGWTSHQTSKIRAW